MLYIVGLPIGNLKDISLRALEVLGEVDIIACEDTRNTLKLLSHYKISKKLISYHKFNEQKMSDTLIGLLNEGKNIALVSDSGMPLISDPGRILIEKLKKNDIKYTIIGGISAFLSALILSGKNAQGFIFLGFLPEKKSLREKILKSVKNNSQTLIFYVSPHSLKEDINFIFTVLGKREASLVKEISKIFENVYDFVLGNEIEINEKGEFVLVVEGAKEETKPKLEFDKKALLASLSDIKMQGLKENQAIAKLAKEKGTSKSELYKFLKIK